MPGGDMTRSYTFFSNNFVWYLQKEADRLARSIASRVPLGPTIRWYYPDPLGTVKGFITTKEGEV